MPSSPIRRSGLRQVAQGSPTQRRGNQSTRREVILAAPGDFKKFPNIFTDHDASPKFYRKLNLYLGITRSSDKDETWSEPQMIFKGYTGASSRAFHAGDHEGGLEPATSGIFGAPRGKVARPFRGTSARNNFYQLSGRLRRCEWKETCFYFLGLSSLPFFSSLFFSALGGLSALSEIT